MLKALSKREILIKKALFTRIGYTPHWGQETIHFKSWIFHVAVWGRRSGKTLSAAMEAIYVLAQPNKRVWIVAPNYALTEKVFREVYRLVVLENILGSAKQVVVQKRQDVRSGGRIEMAWGSWIEAKSCDNPDALVGEGLDFLIMDEAAKISQGVYEKYLEPTLLDRKGRCLMITTPEGHNWLHKMFMRGNKEEHQATGWSSSHFMSADNPYLDQVWIENKKRELGYNEVFRQEYEASFEHHTGLVWPEFSTNALPRGHIFDDTCLEVPAGENRRWTRYRSIDIGLDNPTACIWFAVDAKNNVWVYDEYRVRNTLADVHAENIKTKTIGSVATTYIGHDVDKTSITDGKSVGDIFTSRGIYTYAVRPNKTASIQIVARYLRSALEDNPTHPALYVHERCGDLIEELLNYVWTAYKGSSEKSAPDKPRDYKDDLVDCLRNALQMEPKQMNLGNQMEIDYSDYRIPKIRRDGTGHAGI